MNFKKIDGIFDVGFSEMTTTDKWLYQISDFTDFYDLNMMASIGEDLKGSELVFISYPEGRTYKPFKIEKGIYYQEPTYYEEALYFIKADFNQKSLAIIKYLPEEDKKEEIFLVDIEKINLYNLKLDRFPLMLVSQDENLEIYYPERLTIKKKANESFLFRDRDNFYFEAWFESGLERNGSLGSDYGYHEEIVIKDKNSSVLLQKRGCIFEMKNGEIWTNVEIDNG